MKKDKHIKVLFHLEQDEDGYPPFSIEGLWCKKASNDTYIVDNVPFYTYGISLGDEICVTEEDGEYHFQSIVNPSGNSTLRVHFNDKRMQMVRDKLLDMGCKVEISNLSSFVSINVPQEVSLTTITNSKPTEQAARCQTLIAEKNMNNWIETSGSPFVIVEQQYAHQWKGQENYNAICNVTDYLGKIYIDNHVLLVMGDEPMATRIVNKDGAILIIRWKYAPDYLTVEKLLENDIVTGAEPIEEVEVKWDSTELVLFDSLSPYCEASVKVFLSLQKTSCIIKTYLYQKDEVSLIIHSIQ